VFCLLNSDLIRACYAGALPSFAECKQLTTFYCEHNQFTGAYSRVSTDRIVVPVLQTVVFCLLNSDSITLFFLHVTPMEGLLPSFAECKQLTEFDCGGNKFTGTQVR
jgi:hypothetical protein